MSSHLWWSRQSLLGTFDIEEFQCIFEHVLYFLERSTIIAFYDEFSCHNGSHSLIMMRPLFMMADILSYAEFVSSTPLTSDPWCLKRRVVRVRAKEQKPTRRYRRTDWAWSTWGSGCRPPAASWAASPGTRRGPHPRSTRTRRSTRCLETSCSWKRSIGE